MSEKLSEKLKQYFDTDPGYWDTDRMKQEPILVEAVRALEAERDGWQQRYFAIKDATFGPRYSTKPARIEQWRILALRAEDEREQWLEHYRAARVREDTLVKLNDELQARVDELDQERDALIANVHSLEKQRDYARLEADTLAKRVAILENMLANLTTPEAINASPESGLLP